MHLNKHILWPLRALVIALAFISVGTVGAVAGSAAQAIDPLSLRLGPGSKYKIVSELDEGTSVSVEQCQRRWCLVDANNVRGWVSIDHLTFGVEPRGPIIGPKLHQALRGSGKVCFHTGTNFSGESICSKTGMVVPDLALHGYDNAFSSVSIEGEISVHVCREFNFSSYCETIIEDQAELSEHLKRAVSSYRVW